jgi:DNA-binding MarR family transcriptional regulator
VKQKQIGFILIIFSIILAGFVYMTKLQEDAHIETMIQIQNGSCYLDDGTCLHDDRKYTIYVIGYVIAATMLLLGLYLSFVDKTQQILEKQSKQISEALRDAKKHEKEKDEFGAFLSGFTDDEQKIIKSVKDQEGIQQSTLRYKRGLSKTSLSLILKSLEEREIISRKEDGKTNKVYLRNR